MGLILNFAKWQKLHEQSSSFKTFTPTLPVATANEIVEFIKTNQWSTGGWVPLKANETVFYKIDDRHNSTGQIMSTAMQNNPVDALGVTVYKLYVMDKTPESWPLSQLSPGNMYSILSSQGTGEDGSPIADFKTIGTWLRAESPSQFVQTNKYGFASLFVDPSTVEFGAKLYTLMGPKAKEQFKKQVQAIAGGKIADKDATYLNQYKASAATLLSKLA
jgi:uncharacterized protein (DUF4213/DUF364 family)